MCAFFPLYRHYSLCQNCLSSLCHAFNMFGLALFVFFLSSFYIQSSACIMTTNHHMLHVFSLCVSTRDTNNSIDYCMCYHVNCALSSIRSFCSFFLLMHFYTCILHCVPFSLLVKDSFCRESELWTMFGYERERESEGERGRDREIEIDR